MTAVPAWPASEDAIRMIVDAGISDAKAARIFGVHSRTFASRRRKLIGTKTEALDGSAPNPAEYGFDPEAKWPDGVRFEDDPAAVRATCRGRLPTRPETVLPTASTAGF